MSRNTGYTMVGHISIVDVLWAKGKNLQQGLVNYNLR